MPSTRSNKKSSSPKVAPVDIETQDDCKFFEITFQPAKTAPTKLKLTENAKFCKSPLVDRMSNASKNRLNQLNEIKQKAIKNLKNEDFQRRTSIIKENLISICKKDEQKIKIAENNKQKIEKEFVEKRQQEEKKRQQVLKNKMIRKSEDENNWKQRCKRLSSAELKRSQLLQEKKNKAFEEITKIEKVKINKEIVLKKVLQEKLNKAKINHENYLQEIKQKAVKNLKNEDFERRTRIIEANKENLISKCKKGEEKMKIVENNKQKIEKDIVEKLKTYDQKRERVFKNKMMRKSENVGC